MNCQNLLIIEAQQADLARGFLQLGAELIALDQWTRSDNPLLYGAITTGDAWKFGYFERANRVLRQDIGLYAIPSDLRDLLENKVPVKGCGWVYGWMGGWVR